MDAIPDSGVPTVADEEKMMSDDRGRAALINFDGVIGGLSFDLDLIALE